MGPCKYGSSLKSFHLSTAAPPLNCETDAIAIQNSGVVLSAATTRRRRGEGFSIAASSSCLRFLKKKKKSQRERKQRGRSVLLATATNSPTSPLILFFIRCTRMQSLERCGNPRTLPHPKKFSSSLKHDRSQSHRLTFSDQSETFWRNSV